MDDLKEIGQGVASGGFGAAMVAWAAKMFIADKLETLKEHTREIAEIKSKMVTKQDLESTAENLQDLIREESRGVTTRIDALFTSLRSGK